MADPLDEYNRELEGRDIPLTRGQELLRGLGNLLEAPSPRELGRFAFDAARTGMDMTPTPFGLAPQGFESAVGTGLGQFIAEYLQEPSSVARDIETGNIPVESMTPEQRSRVAEAYPDMDIFNPEDLFALDERIDSDYDFALPSQSGGPRDRGALGEQIRGRRRRSVEREVDRALTSKMDADAAAATPGGSAANTEQMFTAAMQDYIQQARGAGPDAPEERSLEDYKKEFAEATGIDISGKPDKSAALMAFGLALMQNKAGRGFNIGNMLSSVGEAGSAALPALEQAKERARQDAIAAGQYALQARSADEEQRAAAREAAMERGNYFIVPKSEDVAGFLAGIGSGRGRLESLSKYELNRLQSNPEFMEKFDILPGSMWGSVVEAAMATPEAEELYLTSAKEMPLFEGATDPLFTIRVYDPDPNANPNGQPIMAGNGQDQYEALARMARDAQNAKEEFIDLGILNEGTSIYRYTLDSLNSVASAFGVPVGENVPETQKMRMVLERLQAKNAPEILGEAGKTISDADRARVAAIVGEIGPMSDPRELASKFESLFNDIVLGAESDIRQGLNTLNRLTGRNIGGFIDSDELSEEEEEERRLAMQAIMGI